MASCITTGVNSTCPQVRLTVTQTASTNTQVTLSWSLDWVTHGYTFSSSASKSYTAYVNGTLVASGSFAIGDKTSQNIKSGSVTVYKGTSAKTVSFSCSMDFTTAKWSGTALGNRTASGSISVAAKPSYTVSYNANGGSGAPGSQTKWYDETLTLSWTTPTRTGYSFKHWNLKSDGSGSWYNPGGAYTSNSSTTLYAAWNINTYTISYNANGGSGAPGNQTKTYGTNLTLSSTKPTRTGYTFLGWSTSSSATSATYSAGGTYTANSGATLYAVWKIITYTVSYNANGGSNAPSAQSKNHGATLTLTNNKPSRTGYTFNNWNTAANGSGTSYSPGASYTANSNVTLYAQWSANSYTVLYNANGGTGAPANQIKYHDTTLTLSSTKPTRTYYNFLGWGTSASATTVAYAPGANYTNNSAITLYAVWELAYVRPRIKNLSIARCTSDGTISDEGQYALVTCSWEVDTVATAVDFNIEWKSPAESSYSNRYTVPIDGNSGTIREIVGSNILYIEDTFNFRISVVDNLGSTSTSRDLPPMEFTVDFLSGGKGMAVGRPAKKPETLDIGWKARLLGGSYVFTSLGLNGTWGYIKLATIKVKDAWFNIPIELRISQRGRTSFATMLINFQNTDSLDPNVNSFIFSANYDIGAYLVRSDIGTWDLYIEKTEGYDSVTIVDFKCDLEYFNNRADITWISNEQVNDINPVIADVSYIKASRASSVNEIAVIDDDETLTLQDAFNQIEEQGEQIAALESEVNVLGQNKTLWSGHYYMTENQVVNLPESISKQSTGIVLVFSRYDIANSEPLNEHFCYHFVPKIMVTLHPNKGSIFPMSTSNETYAASKYLYISDTQITGHANNGAVGTGNTGVTYNNNRFVLRYVIGV